MGKQFWIAIAAFILLAISNGCTSPQQSRATSSAPKLPTVIASANCPYQTPVEWETFLIHAADNQKWVETCEDSTCDEDYYFFVKEKIEDVFIRCDSFLATHPKIAACVDSLRRFTPSWLRQHDSDSYGFNIKNHAYLTDQENPDRPSEMMKLPPEIVSALPSRFKVEAVAQRMGWKYLTHDSALGGERTFILISDPEDRFDQWMLLNLNGGTSLKDDTPLSLLAVQKKDSQGKPLAKVQLHFRDYTIHQSARGYRLSLNEDNNGKCFSCHVSGVRQLIARHTSVLVAGPVAGEAGNELNPDEFAFQRLLEFNRRLRSYGMPDWEGKITPENHGPALGKSQGCTDCHNGESRGVLSVLTSPEQLERKMVKELSMPSDGRLPKLLERSQMNNPKLSSEEKKTLEKAFLSHEELAQGFEDSRFPTLKQWFLQTPCR